MRAATAYTPLGIAVSGWSFAGIGDFNGGGTSDILYANNGTSEVWLMRGDQVIQGLVGPSLNGGVIQVVS